MNMKPNLQDLTVFIITSGEDTAGECEKSLNEQNCTFAIKYIKDTYPMSKAFQRMPDECTTKYFIQVDGDMVLKPHAIRTLYEGTKNSSFYRFMSYGQLYEEGFGVGGSVRCWKKSLFTFFKFRDCRTVDRDLYKRIRWFGLRSKNLDQVLGQHLARHSSFTNYLKSKSDVEKWRFLGRAPKKYALPVLENCIKSAHIEGSILLGTLIGALTPKKRLIRSKDIKVETTRFNELIGYLKLDNNISKLKTQNIEKSKITALFVNAYKEITNTHTKNKFMLADIIIDYFSNNNTSTPEILLDIADK